MKNIQGDMWTTLFPNESFSQDKFKFVRDNTTNYLILENATNNNNKAEKALLSISLLQKEIGLYKEMYSFYMGLKGLSLIGLESYARRHAIEENFDFLSNENYKTYQDKDLIEVFLDKLVTEKNLSHTTLSSYSSDLNLFNNFLNKKNSITNCNEGALKKWVNFLVDNKIKSSSRIRKISVIKQFFRFLYEEKFMKLILLQIWFCQKK